MPKNKVRNKGSYNVTHSANAASVMQSSSVSRSVTPEQYQQLMAILNNASGGVTSTFDNPEVHLASKTHVFARPVCLANYQLIASDWIIDTGASNHTTTSFHHLIQHVTINFVIHLPNGKTSKLTHKGTIILSDDITLYNMLYVPDFKFNLISGSKLTSHNNCYLIFSTNTCLL